MRQKNRIRIAIVGTHSVGKTSIVEFLATHHTYDRIVVINEVARDLISKGYQLGKGGTQDVYFKYVDEQLKREIESANADYDLLISDRSLVDGISYPIINERLGITEVSSDLLSLFERIVQIQKEFYHAYIYVPICFNNVVDGVRDHEEDYRLEADIEIKRLLREHIGSYYVLNCGTVAEMAGEVMTIVSRLRQNPSSA